MAETYIGPVLLIPLLIVSKRSYLKFILKGSTESCVGERYECRRAIWFLDCI